MYSINWKVKKDSLIFNINGNNYGRYKILKLSNEIMIILDMQKKWLKDTLVFMRSNDQTTRPIEGDMLPPDTALWPIKLNKKQ